MAKITRMQQRRGLHRDLPLPLKPGEIGLTTDTRELFIGNDTADGLGGIHNKTIQVGNVSGGYNHVNSLLTSNIIEFTVKRSIISGQTGVGPFTIQKIHSGLSALASASIILETGINDQTLKIYKYSPANYSHKKLLPGDPDGAPVVIGDYNITGTNSLNLVNALVSNDIVYVVYLNKKDLETNLINAFNANFNLSSGSLSDLTLKLSVDQLYFDESTGEGFIGLNDAQITDTSYTGAGGKTIQTWLQEWITSASNAINAAFVGDLDASFYSNNSLTGGKGIARFGDDTNGDSTAESAIPSYTFDSDLGFTTRSHEAAINMAKFLNQSWLMEGSTPTRELSHLRSNIKIVTENNAGDLWSNIAIGNPLTRDCKPTNIAGTNGNQVKGAQTMRLLGSTSTTNQINIGGVYYNTSGTRNLEMDYVIEWDGGTPPNDYHIVRTGKAIISMPLLDDGTNVYGHGLILDQWNEMDIKDSTGDPLTHLTVGADFDLGVLVSPIVTIYGDPVIVNDYAGASALSDAAFNTKYGVTPSVVLASRDTTGEMDAAVTADTQVFWADDDSTSATYKQYFGFITYSNTRPVLGQIRFINKRF